MSDEDGNNKDEALCIEQKAERTRRKSTPIPPSSTPYLETSPLLGDNNASYGFSRPRSWTTHVGPAHYTQENKPNRRPFVHGSTGRLTSHGGSSNSMAPASEADALLFTRYRYYSRLRAPVESDEAALVMPDHIVPRELFLPYLPGMELDSDGKQSSTITIIAIWNTMMGTSLLTMPWAFGQAGYALGLVIMLSMAAVCLYTSYRLLNLQKDMGLEGARLELSEVCRQLLGGSLGRITEGLTVIFSMITLVGAMVVYWVLMSNFLFNTGEMIHGAITGEFNGSDTTLLCPPNNTDDNSVKKTKVDATDNFHRWWVQDETIPIFLLLPFVIICNLRNTSILAKFNSLGAVAVCVMYMYVISKAIEWGINIDFSDTHSQSYVPLYKSSFMALSGTLSLAYFIHNCVVTIMQGNRNQENNTRDLSIAYGMVAATYIPIAIIAYTTFPLPKFCISDNFLDNFPPHNIALGIVRCFLLIQIMTVFPLISVFVRNQLFTFFLGPGFSYNYRRTFCLNAILLTMCVLVAIFYPRIGFIIRWIGAVSGLAYVFVLPCVTYMVCLYKKEKLTWLKALFHGLLIIIGIANFISQFFN